MCSYNYIYIYVDPTRKGRFQYPDIPFCFLYEPFYVGKGRDKRMYAHITEAKHYRKTDKHKRILDILALGIELRDYIIQCFKNLPDEEAYSAEYYLVDKIGRSIVNRGPLLNIAVGGCGAKANQNRKFSESDLAEVKRLYESGIGTTTISKKFNVSDATVSKALRDSGISLRPINRIPEDMALAICKDYSDGMSSPQLEKKYGVTNANILRTVKKRGGKTRTNFKISNLPEEDQLDMARRYELGATSTQLAAEYGVHYTSILTLLRKNGVTIRPSHISYLLEYIPTSCKISDDS